MGGASKRAAVSTPESAWGATKHSLRRRSTSRGILYKLRAVQHLQASWEGTQVFVSHDAIDRPTEALRRLVQPLRPSYCIGIPTKSIIVTSSESYPHAVTSC